MASEELAKVRRVSKGILTYLSYGEWSVIEASPGCDRDGIGAVGGDL
jgi:hypothetical protein